MIAHRAGRTWLDCPCETCSGERSRVEVAVDLALRETSTAPDRPRLAMRAAMKHLRGTCNPEVVDAALRRRLAGEPAFPCEPFEGKVKP